MVFCELKDPLRFILPLVPFEYCERPPMISHGYMKSPMDDVYPVLSQVRYECHIGCQMKGKRTLKCLTTGCWSPNELPECIREDLHGKF